LPSGVTFNAATGVLAGTPAAGTGGTYNITFTAHNGIGSDATQSFTLTVPLVPTAKADAFVLSAFQQYLNRKPTDGQLAQHVGQFKAGGSQRDVQKAIINLPEYANTPPPPASATVGKPLYGL